VVRGCSRLLWLFFPRLAPPPPPPFFFFLRRCILHFYCLLCVLFLICVRYLSSPTVPKLVATSVPLFAPPPSLLLLISSLFFVFVCMTLTDGHLTVSTTLSPTGCPFLSTLDPSSHRSPHAPKISSPFCRCQNLFYSLRAAPSLPSTPFFQTTRPSPPLLMTTSPARYNRFGSHSYRPHRFTPFFSLLF